MTVSNQKAVRILQGRQLTIQRKVEVLRKQIEILQSESAKISNFLTAASYEASELKETNSAHRLSMKAREQRIEQIRSFMRSRGGKNVHADEIANHLRISKEAAYIYMTRRAREPNPHWKHGKIRSRFTLTEL